MINNTQAKEKARHMPSVKNPSIQESVGGVWETSLAICAESFEKPMSKLENMVKMVVINLEIEPLCTT